MSRGEKKSAVICVEIWCQLHKMWFSKQSLFLLQVVSLTQKSKLNSVEPMCDGSLTVHYESNAVGEEKGFLPTVMANPVLNDFKQYDALITQATLHNGAGQQLLVHTTLY